MSGLLAAHQLRRFKPTVYEAQSELPNNHSALLRFRSDAVSRATGIPFKKVSVQKAICFNGVLHEKSSIRFNNLYSNKVTGRVMGRSIMNLEPGERYIAPDDFIAQMASGLDIRYNSPLDKHHLLNEDVKDSPAVSTMPMAALMKIAGWDCIPHFGYSAITTLSCDIEDVDIYQTLYFPGDEVEAYRASLTGGHFTAEIVGQPSSGSSSLAYQACLEYLKDFGINKRQITNVSVKTQKYGKIYPTDNNLRKQFILAMTDRYGIYSIGRFATWRQILMDDVVRDISLVEQMITERSSYASHLPLAV